MTLACPKLSIDPYPYPYAGLTLACPKLSPTTYNPQPTTPNDQLSTRIVQKVNARAPRRKRAEPLMKLSKDEAVALTATLALMRPDWVKAEIVNLIGAHREQESFGAFVEQAVAHALAGHPLIAIVHPFERPAPLVVFPGVVNEDDPSKSRLLRKSDSSDSREAVVRHPNDDPKHWRNRFKADFEKGKREHEELLRKMRHAPDELTDADLTTITNAREQHRLNELARTQRVPQANHTGNAVNDALNDLADSMLTRHALAPDDEFSAEAIAARQAEGERYSHDDDA
ncbi:hypothetical protein SEA_ABBA_40 [Arthrobacter phage Abba]|uniref:Uncharacterized protein n=1 Tax=Arthrobacter phage Abba TaxID=2713256 RepID=A0A6G8R2E3_9CAUD|nr:hypothetical protein HYQ28_gp40 [Arthrobacter phage Abba]QIN94369.1 hypothetical protein SEA_ABBA_40 [Arthrobacter phage Abba]